MGMRSILFILAHPHLRESRANRIIFERVRSLPNLEAHQLYEVYPEFHIDVAAEKKRLDRADIIVLQHPLYWYSMPPLLKLWFDVVLEYGYAYGPGGRALQGKSLLLSLTIGGAATSYQTGGENFFPLQAFLPPYEQTARLCGLKWVEPSLLYAAMRSSSDAIEAHAEALRERLVALSNPNFSNEVKA